MPKTVSGGFAEFLQRLTPSDFESAQAMAHRASILECLKERFNLQYFFRSGSFGNGTSVSGFSDVDYFAVLADEFYCENSNATLAIVHAALDQQFPHTSIHVSCPAVAVPFAGSASDSTEVVPARLLLSMAGSSRIFAIANCRGGWMRSSPEGHGNYVKAIDLSKANRVRPLIRFIKAWKYFNDVPVSSFYLELFVASYAVSRSEILYDRDVLGVFRALRSGYFPNVFDPLAVSGLIHACESPIDKFIAIQKLVIAISHAETAVDRAAAGQDAVAFAWWNNVFNGHFPAYGS